MQTFTFKELIERTMTGDEVFCLYPEALDEIQRRNERSTELEDALKSCMVVIERQRMEVAKFAEASAEALEEGAKAMSLMASDTK